MDALVEPFTPSDVQWRVGATNKEKTKGVALAYIDSRAVMDRLDTACGPENWRDEYKEGPGGGQLCGISILCNGEWVTKWDGASNTNFEAVKGGLSDAFKRAAVKWGIGRYLYSLPSPWCKIKAAGNSYKLLERPILPEWAYPKNYKGTKDKGAGVVVNEVPAEEEEQDPSNENGTATASITAKSNRNGKTKANGNSKAAAKTNGNGAAKTNGNSAAKSNGDSQMEKAKAYKVPADLPLTGTPLGVAMNDAAYGSALIKFLAGEGTNKDGKKFEPAAADDKKVQAAAKYIMENEPLFQKS